MSEPITPKPQTRNVKVFLLRPEEFMSLFTKGMKFYKNATVFQGVPADATIQGMGTDPIRGGVMLVVHSAEFEPIPVTQSPPVIELAIDLGQNISTKKHKK